MLCKSEALSTEGTSLLQVPKHSRLIAHDRLTVLILGTSLPPKHFFVCHLTPLNVARCGCTSFQQVWAVYSKRLKYSLIFIASVFLYRQAGGHEISRIPQHQGCRFTLGKIYSGREYKFSLKQFPTSTRQMTSARTIIPKSYLHTTYINCFSSQ